MLQMLVVFAVVFISVLALGRSWKVATRLGIALAVAARIMVVVANLLTLWFAVLPKVENALTNAGAPSDPRLLKAIAVPLAILLYAALGGAARQLIYALISGRKLIFVAGLALLYSLVQVLFALADTSKRPTSTLPASSQNEFRIRDVLVKAGSCAASERDIVCAVTAVNQSEADKSLRWYNDAFATDNRGRLHFAGQFDSGGFPTSNVNFLPHVNMTLRMTFKDVDSNVSEFQNLRLRVCCATRSAGDWVNRGDVKLDFRNLSISRPATSAVILAPVSPSSISAASTKARSVSGPIDPGSHYRPRRVEAPDIDRTRQSESTAPTPECDSDRAASINLPTRHDVPESSVQPTDSGLGSVHPEDGAVRSPVNLAVGVILDGQTVGLHVGDALNGFLESPRFPNVVALSDAETRSATRLLDRLYPGNEASLRQVTERTRADYLLLVKGEYHIRTQSSLDPDLVICELAVRCRLVDHHGRIIQSGYFSSMGPGFTPLQAVENAVERVGRQVSGRILQRLPE